MQRALNGKRLIADHKRIYIRPSAEAAMTFVALKYFSRMIYLFATAELETCITVDTLKLRQNFHRI